MDRRNALKKLGVGGAVAVSAPVLLDSFNIASAASPANGPAGSVAFPNPPVIQSSSITMSFSVAAFNFSGTPSFTWTLTSPATGFALTPGPVGTAVISKTGSANPEIFTITVDVSDGTTFVASYLLTATGKGTTLQVAKTSA